MTGQRGGALALLALLACAPLQEPAAAGAEVRRCPRPCPAACAGSCLPGGFCGSVARTAFDLALGPRRTNESWQAALGGFPPGALVTYAIHAGFDIVERAGASPASESIVVMISGEDGYAFQLQGERSSFPLWADTSGAQPAGADGALSLSLQLAQCDLGAHDTCTLDPASTFTATLVDPRPWQEAPACE